MLQRFSFEIMDGTRRLWLCEFVLYHYIIIYMYMYVIELIEYR